MQEILWRSSNHPHPTESFAAARREPCGNLAASPNTSESTLDSIDGQASPGKTRVHTVPDNPRLRFRSTVVPSKD